MEKTLESVQAWATERLRSGTEPPWSYYRLMQLLDAIAGLRDPDADITRGYSPQSEQRSESGPQREADIVQLDTVRRRPDCSTEQRPT